MQRKKQEPEFEEETEYIADEAPETESENLITEADETGELSLEKADFDISEAPRDPSWETYQSARDAVETDAEVDEEDKPDDSDEPEIYRR